jgi:hypothetical protein
VLGYVNSSAAIFATQSKSLKYADNQENDRRRNTNRGVSRQETDQLGRAAHNQKRHQEGIFASHQIADASEEERPERTNYKPHREG